MAKILIVSLLFMLAGCGENQNNVTQDWHEFRDIEGLECLLYKKQMNYGTAISCNWEKYNDRTEEN